MYNNISLELEKKALRDALQYFDENNKDEMEIYRVFERCSKDDVDAKKMVEELKSLGDLKEYNNNFRTFVDSRIKDLELLQKSDKEIEDLKEEILKENKKLEESLKNRNISYEDDIKKKEKDIDTNDLIYLEDKKSKEELEKDLELLKDKNKVLEKEKVSGEEFDEKLENKSNSDYLENSTHDDQMEKIQEDAYKNKQIYNNPSGDYVSSCYNYYLENQSENSKMDVKINYNSNNEVEIVLGYKGTEVNENYPSLSFTYSGEDQMDTYYNEVYPFLIDEHVIDGQTETRTEEGHLESTNSNDETLEVNANTDEVLEIKNDINKTIDRKKGVVRKREFDLPNNYGLNNMGIFIILLFSVIVICLVIICVELF